MSMECPRCHGKGTVEDDRVVGAYMRNLRKGIPMTLRGMARQLGFSPAYLSDLELGRRRWTTKLRQAYERFG